MLRQPEREQLMRLTVKTRFVEQKGVAVWRDTALQHSQSPDRADDGRLATARDDVEQKLVPPEQFGGIDHAHQGFFLMPP